MLLAELVHAWEPRGFAVNRALGFSVHAHNVNFRHTCVTCARAHSRPGPGSVSRLHGHQESACRAAAMNLAAAAPAVFKHGARQPPAQLSSPRPAGPACAHAHFTRSILRVGFEARASDSESDSGSDCQES